jgi:hypothetical protein
VNVNEKYSNGDLIILLARKTQLNRQDAKNTKIKAEERKKDIGWVMSFG